MGICLIQNSSYNNCLVYGQHFLRSLSCTNIENCSSYAIKGRTLRVQSTELHCNFHGLPQFTLFGLQNRLGIPYLHTKSIHRKNRYINPKSSQIALVRYFLVFFAISVEACQWRYLQFSGRVISGDFGLQLGIILMTSNHPKHRSQQILVSAYFILFIMVDSKILYVMSHF